MNRVIKFRGLRTDGKGWVYGSLSMVDTRSQQIGKNQGQMFICEVQNAWQNTENGRLIGYWIEVHPETVSQFTGLVDKNGVEIYCDDILDNGKLVYWSNEQACYFCGDNPLCMSNSHRAIIGNIHEHKHLLI